ncbi:MAG: hypothetical protein IPK72_12260 [Candidatus Eisenbacteria bacterium]|nr:hypothetical protein [Candidatus Eisenbacteria bacterium]
MTLSQIRSIWAPLAMSWVLMGLELPLVSAVVARLAQPEIHLAAYGGVVFPLSMLIESPIIMLLAAATALARDGRAYHLIRRFMMISVAALTALHALLAFTPLFELVVLTIVKPPPEVVEPARLGLRLMLPWTWSIAYRRFNHGVMIRDGRSRFVGLGTLVRLGALASVLTFGLFHRELPGIAVASGAVAFGVLSEAIFAGVVARPSIRRLRAVPAEGEALSFARFVAFYTPLALTSLIHLVITPIMAASLTRMPRPLESLAVWPVVTGIGFTLRSVGIAFNEVVVSTLERPGAPRALRHFMFRLSGLTFVIHLIMVATPLAGLYFASVSGLAPALAGMAANAWWLALPATCLAVVQSWYTGLLTAHRQTRAIPEAVTLSVVASGLVLAAGIGLQRSLGLYIGVAGLGLGNLAMLAWLHYRTRSIRAGLRLRDMPPTAARDPRGTVDIPEV